MTTKQYINNVEEPQETTIMGLPKPSTETIRLVGMMQLALITSVGIVRGMPMPILISIMFGYVMLYPWFGDRGLIEVMMK